MDCLEEVDTSLDVFYMHHNDITICSDEPGQVYESAPEGKGTDHGERYYRDISGNFIRVFVSETEAVGDSPFDKEFWTPYFAKDNISRHIYQGILAGADAYHISTQDVKEAMSPVEPQISTPT